MPYHKRLFVTPGRLILLSAFIAITVGSLLLALPWAHTGVMSYIDLVFTAASAVSSTGLMTVPLDQFTFFGHLIMLVLIQLGGLGVITLSIFLMSFVMNLGIGAQMIAGQILELDTVRGLRQLVRFIVRFTLMTELLGALCVYMTLPTDIAWTLRLWYAVAHSVSSFCNAGILFLPTSLVTSNTNMPFFAYHRAIGAYWWSRFFDLARTFALSSYT